MGCICILQRKRQQDMRKDADNGTGVGQVVAVWNRDWDRQRGPATGTASRRDLSQSCFCLRRRFKCPLASAEPRQLGHFLGFINIFFGLLRTTTETTS